MTKYHTFSIRTCQKKWQNIFIWKSHTQWCSKAGARGGTHSAGRRFWGCNSTLCSKI